MTSNQRIDEFLKLQDKGISLDEIGNKMREMYMKKNF